MLLTPWSGKTHRKARRQAAIRFAEEAMARQDWREAAERWRAVLAGASATGAKPAVFEQLAMALRLSGDAHAAEAAAREGLARHPHDPRVGIQFAEAAMAKQDWHEAARRWQALIDRHPDQLPATAYVRCTAALRRCGSRALAEADAIAQRAIARDPDHLGLLIQHAETAMARMDWVGAVRRWEVVLQKGGDHLPPDTLARIDAALQRAGGGAPNSINEWLRRTESAHYAALCATEDTLDDTERQRLARWIQSWPAAPVISVVMPCWNTKIEHLTKAVESVRGQIYQQWELCIADDASSDPSIGEYLRTLGDADPRIKIVLRAERGHMVRATNSALAMATGAFCQFLDHDDLLAPHALAFIAGEIVRDPAIDWIYSDVDRVDQEDRRCAPLYRSAPDPDLCLTLAHMGAHAAFRTDFLRSLDGMRDGTEGAHDHDLALRALLCTPLERIRHVPNVLYHWRIHEDSSAGHFLQKPYAVTSREGAIRHHLEGRGIRAEVRQLQASNGARVKYEMEELRPLVSILIPTRNALGVLRRCIESLRERTDYPRIELILIDNGTDDPAALRYLRYLESSEIARVLPAPGPFNWSRLNNLAARHAKGEILCLLNNDVEAINNDWLQELVSHVLRPGVGVAGAALWYPDGRLQHGGVYFAPTTGEALHALKGTTRTQMPAVGHVVRTVSAVTGACLVVKRSTYLEVGGMDEDWLPVGYNDVDFCLRVRERLGLRCVWTPHAELTHFESASRSALDTEMASRHAAEARRTVAARWHEHLLDDPHFSPTLTRVAAQAAFTRPGARRRLRRYQLPRPRGLAFIHIPKTAGVALRDRLLQHLPRPAVQAISARTLLRCYEGEEAAITAVNRRLQEADILFSHFSYGFGALVGWDCCYATMLRDPAARTLSQYRHMFQRQSSPFSQAPLAKTPLAVLLQKGVIPGNLMIRKILGEPPETVRWTEIAAFAASAAGFAGFGLPKALWQGDHAQLLNGPDRPPDSDLAIVDRAMEIITRDFAFVGRLDRVESQLERLGSSLGLGSAQSLSRLNESDASAPPILSVADRDAMEEYNQLDRALFDRIGGLDEAMYLDPGKLTSWSLTQ